MANWINALGLTLDIAGVILLFRFGLPPAVDRSGAVHLIAEEADEAEVAKGRRYDFWGRVGLVLILVGFLLQLVSNFA